MRTDRDATQRRGAQGPGASQRSRSPSAVRSLAALVLTLALCPSAAAATHAGHACRTTPPAGHAACMAMRLILRTGSSSTGAKGSVAKGRTISVTAGRRPFPGFLTPARLHEAYELPGETPAASTQTIAVVDAFNDPTAEADLAVFDRQFRLAACTSENGCFRKVNQDGNAAPLPRNEGGWASEISIDVQMAHAICEDCHILLVETRTDAFSNLGAGVNAAIKDGATEVSNSYAGTEEAAYEGLARADFDHPGIVIGASSGDCGYLNELCPGDAPGASFPADSPDVLAIGGTSLTKRSGVWSSVAWEESGSGCSALFSAPSWQNEATGSPATGCGGARAIADVAAVADPDTGVDVYDSTPEEPGAPVGWGVWGGTSVATPIVTAEFGLAGGAHGIAYPAAALYAHHGDATALQDVLSGANGSCAGTTICNVTPGYDGPTGLGSPLGLAPFVLLGTAATSSVVTSTPAARKRRLQPWRDTWRQSTRGRPARG